MSNEITNNFKKQFNVNRYVSQPSLKEEIENNIVMSENHILDKEIESSMPFLGTMGEAQVQMNKNSVKKSVAQYLNDTEYVKAHINFCDGLIKDGYKLEHAINKTDNVFKVLKIKSTYKE